MKRTAVTLAVLVTAGCLERPEKNRAPAPHKGAGASASKHGPTIVPPPRSPVDGAGPTTDGAIAVKNMSGQIEDYERILSKDPARLAAYTGLTALYQTRAQFLSTLADYDRAEKMANARFARTHDAQSCLGRASVSGSFHHFADALADLAAAEKQHAKPDAVASIRASVLQGMGHTQEALALREAIVKRNPGVMAIGTLATLKAEMGDTEEADALFAKAPADYRDVSPFPIAWIDFQRGNMWEKAGQVTKAKTYYQAALERLPAYAPAIGHMASMEAATGDRAGAIARLRPLVATSDDPEYEGQLANLLAQTGQDAEAKTFRDKAAARFEELLKAHPEAFADHAARFYLDVEKDAKRAEQLALLNLGARQTRDAYELALDSSLGAKDVKKACEVADQAMAQLPKVERLRYLAGRAYQACGKPGEAAALKHATATAAAQ